MSSEAEEFIKERGLSSVVELAQDYETLRDCVIDELNPADDDASEDYIMCRAVTAAAMYIASIPCTCPADVDATYERCGRCAALGRRGDRRYE